jgi:hypothetical protein
MRIFNSEISYSENNAASYAFNSETNPSFGCMCGLFTFKNKKASSNFMFNFFIKKEITIEALLETPA